MTEKSADPIDENVLQAHYLLASYLAPDPRRLFFEKPQDSEAGRTVLSAAPTVQIAIARLILQDLVQQTKPNHYHHAILRALCRQILRRTLPMTESDLEEMLGSLVAAALRPAILCNLPISSLLNHVERWNTQHGLTERMKASLKHVRGLIGLVHTAEYRKMGEKIDQLVEPQLPEKTDALEPMPAELTEDTLREAAGLVDEFCKTATATCQWFNQIWGTPMSVHTTGQKIMNQSDRMRVAVLLEAEKKIVALGTPTDNTHLLRANYLMHHLVRTPLPYTDQELQTLLLSLVSNLAHSDSLLTDGSIWEVTERHITRHGLSDTLRGCLEQCRMSLAKENFHLGMRTQTTRINELMGVIQPGLMEPGEAWADAALAEIQSLSDPARVAWKALIAHSYTADGTKPTQRWLKEAHQQLEKVGEAEFVTQIAGWFPLIAQHPTLVTERNSNILKGLVWCCQAVESTDPSRILGDLALLCYHKIPLLGARSAKAGNACVLVLGARGSMEAVSQISRLKLKVKTHVANSLIEKALNQAAARAGLTPEELEEISVPHFDLDDAGQIQTRFGDFSVTVTVSGPHSVQWLWTDSQGKTLASVPTKVTREHTREWKKLKTDIADLGAILFDYRDKFERQLLDTRVWPLALWRARLIDHPTLAVLARRLIWRFETGDQVALGIWNAGTLVDASGQVLVGLTPQTQVSIWHPLTSPPEEVLAWRVWLEENQVRQPFKQAHREVYLLTEAEQTTNTYSNRFAGHILKQHQFHALCQQRGWKYALQGGWDGANTPTLELPRWNTRFEFWVEMPEDGALSASNVALYLVTDQVRFCGLDGNARPLSEIPPILFSEVMRDLDLFVGVCSIGNDPQWRDRGAGGQYDDYWQNYSFGDLSATAQTRRQILERLMPRLKIASQCRLEGKFLFVRGTLRTYKIHLGSGNILMEPNDQYLCIVPSHNSDGSSTRHELFLPFEGDHTLAVILSKAMLLAEDDKIKDQTIVTQIRRGAPQ